MNKELLKKDFYEAINGEWLAKNEIPDHLSGWGSFYELDENIRKLRSSLFHKWLDDQSDIKDNPILKEMIKYFALVKDWNSREANGMKPLKSLIDKIRGFKSWKDIEENYKKLQYLHFYVPLNFFIMDDFKDSTKQILWLQYPDIILPSKNHYVDKEKSKELLTVWRNAAEKLLNKTLPNQKEYVTKLLDDTLKFDALLAKYVLTPEEEAIYPNLYNLFSTSEIQKHCKVFDIKKIANNLTNNKVENISVVSKVFLENINTLYNDETFGQFKSALIVKTILQCSSYLDDESRLIGSEYSNYLRGLKKPIDRNKFEIESVAKFFSVPFGLYYGKTYLGEKGKKDVEKMVNNMVKIYQNKLANNNWLSEETKKYAIKKLNKMGIHIGYPNKIKPFFSKYKVEKYNEFDKLLLNSLNYIYLASEFKYNEYLKPTDKEYWEMPADMVNAYYSPNQNHIVFPAAILAKPFYSLSSLTSENYGGIGTVIAHEISHAFDNNGANFDENGNLVNWWTEEDKKNFDIKTQEMIALFDGVETPVGKCNGKLTVSENIADAGGVSCALEAAKLEKDYDGQKFFINFATIWRIKYRPQLAEMLLKIDVHAPAKLRANIQTKNSDEFYKAFDIEPSDEMYLDPNKRVKIW